MSAQPPASTYVLTGEAFQREEAVRRLVESLLPSHQVRALGLVTLSARGIAAARLIDALVQVPLGGGRRVVLIRDADRIPPDKRLTACLGGGVRGLVVICIAEKAIGRKKPPFGGLGPPTLRAKHFRVITRWSDLAEWAQKRARRELGKALTRGGAYRLVAAVGRDLAQLASELAKVALFVGERERIEERDIEAVGAAAQPATLSRFEAALGRGDAAGAIALAHSFQGGGQDVGRLWYGIRETFARLARAQALEDWSAPKKALAGHLDVPEYRVDDYRTWRARHSPEAVRRALTLIARAEDARRTSGAPEGAVLGDLLLVDLVRDCGNAKDTQHSRGVGRRKNPWRSPSM